MNVEFTRKFEKQFDKIRDKKLKEQISEVVRTVIASESLSQLVNLKKLKGFSTAYRIRTGNFRIGVFYHSGKIIFAALADRKDIYKIFP